MATSCDTTAANFLQSSYRQKLILPRHSLRQTSRLLWVALPRKNPSVGISRGGIASGTSKVRAVISRDVSRQRN